MKKSQMLLLLAPVLLALFAACFQWGYGGGSVGADLYEALEALHGPPCAGRVLDGPQGEGQAILREELAFTVEPASRLALRPWLAVPLGLPYRLRCQAVYARTLTTPDGGVLKRGRQVYVYDGWDDGDLDSTRRAWLDRESLFLSCPDGQGLFPQAP